MSGDGWMVEDPPCWHSGDHWWAGGGSCSKCGERLRCACGQFITVRGVDEHVQNGCPAVPVGEG